MSAAAIRVTLPGIIEIAFACSLAIRPVPMIPTLTIVVADFPSTAEFSYSGDWSQGNGYGIRLEPTYIFRTAPLERPRIRSRCPWLRIAKTQKQVIAMIAARQK